MVVVTLQPVLLLTFVQYYFVFVYCSQTCKVLVLSFLQHFSDGLSALFSVFQLHNTIDVAC